MLAAPHCGGRRAFYLRRIKGGICMFTKNDRLFRHLVSALAMVGAVMAWNSPSDAEVQQIMIDQTVTLNLTPITLGTSTPASSAISYTIYTGRIFGELKPNDPDNNAVITDINLAPKNNGRVQY